MVVIANSLTPEWMSKTKPKFTGDNDDCRSMVLPPQNCEWKLLSPDCMDEKFPKDIAPNIYSKDDFRRLPEECYFYQKNFNAKIIESNEYPRGFGIVMHQNVIWGGFENCINLNARTVADMPTFTQIFAYDSVDVDNTTI